MTRGDQRERDRIKSLKKQQEKARAAGKVSRSIHFPYCSVLQFPGCRLHLPLFTLKSCRLKIDFHSKQGDPLARNASDAAALAAKVAKKQAERAKQEESNKKAETTKRVEPKLTKPTASDPGLDALLDAGLSKGKKK